MNTNNEIQDNEETQVLIDGYLLGTLNAEELSEVKERMALYPEFRKMVAEQKLLSQSVEEHFLKNELDDYHQEIIESNPPKSLSRGWIAIAASFLILVGVTFWALFSGSTSTEKIFAANFKPDPGLPTTMGKTSQYDFYYGMVSYKRKEYTDAIARWETLYSANPKNDTIIYFLGVANLANGNTRQAEKYLLQASTKRESAFYEDAQYYLALSQLKAGHLDKAKETLSKSTSENSKALLKKLKKI